MPANGRWDLIRRLKFKSPIRLPAATHKPTDKQASEPTNKHINSWGRGLVGYSPVYRLEGLGSISKEVMPASPGTNDTG